MSRIVDCDLTPCDACGENHMDIRFVYLGKKVMAELVEDVREGQDWLAICPNTGQAILAEMEKEKSFPFFSGGSAVTRSKPPVFGSTSHDFARKSLDEAVGDE